MVYRCAKQHSEPGSDRRDRRNAKRGAKHGAEADELHLTPLELIARLAALVPPPRVHRHRYFGVLAPNSPLRPAVTALAQDAVVQPAQVQAEPASTAAGEGARGVSNRVSTMRLSQIGMKRPNRRRTSRPISASVGKGGNSGVANAAGQGCAWRCPKMCKPKNLGQLARCKHPSRPQFTGLGCTNPVAYFCSCVWISYPQRGFLQFLV